MLYLVHKTYLKMTFLNIDPTQFHNIPHPKNRKLLTTEQQLRTLNLVISSKVINQLSSTVRIEITRHIISLLHHILTHFIKARRGDYVTVTIYLPGDGCVSH